MEGVLRSPRLDGFTAGGKPSISISLCKNLEDGDRIGHFTEEWVQFEPDTELNPEFPISILFVG